MKNFKYASIIAKLKGMSSKNLNKDDIFNLLKQTDLKSAVYILKNEVGVLKTLDEDADRIKVEQELDKIMINDIFKIIKLLSGNDKEIFYAYIEKYEIKCIKTVIKNLTNNLDMNRNLNIVNLWTSTIFKKIDGIYNVETEDELLIKLKKSKYFYVVKGYIEECEGIKNIQLSKLEMLLDKKYFENLVNKIKDIDNVTKDLINQKIDLLNLIYIYRINKYYKKSSENLNEILIDFNYKITKEEKEKLINCGNFDDILNTLEHSYYFKVIENIDEQNLENVINKYLYKKYRRAFFASKYSIATVISYLALEEYQELNIINILGGITYHLSKDTIQKKIIM